jgi:hypothetical protein
MDALPENVVNAPFLCWNATDVAKSHVERPLCTHDLLRAGALLTASGFVETRYARL